jgi:hypothetical protein
MTRHAAKSETGGGQFEPQEYDGPGAPPPGGAGLEAEPPGDDTRLLRLAEEFFLLADDKDIELF